MILYRTILQAKMGKVNELIMLLKDAFTTPAGAPANPLQPRILTDISGPINTAIVETTHESLATLEQYRHAMFTQPEFSEIFSRLFDLIESGRNEYYTIEL